MSIETVLNQLDKVRSNGRDKWMACCPVHGDKHASLSIKETADGTVLVHCFAGCGANEILSSLGLTFDDLYPKDSMMNRPRERQLISPRDALLAIHHASLVVCVVASDLARTPGIAAAQHLSLLSAVGTITRAVEAVYG